MATGPATPGVVSVDELKNPLSSEDRNYLNQAQKDLDEGRREEGLRKLNAALRQPAIEAYAMGMLGVDQLKRRDFEKAAALLGRSVESLPHNASIHAHYAFALAALGSLDQAEDEVRQALALHPDMHGAQYLLGVLLLNDPQRHRKRCRSCKPLKNRCRKRIWRSRSYMHRQETWTRCERPSPASS